MFITCYGLNDAKKILLRGSGVKILDVIYLNKNKISSTVKGSSH